VGQLQLTEVTGAPGPGPDPGRGPDPGPNPAPGGLKVQGQAVPEACVAWCEDEHGAPVAANLTARADGQELGTLRSEAGHPVRWLSHHSAARWQVHAVADDGRTGDRAWPQ
jgi:hypothetical protein